MVLIPTVLQFVIVFFILRVANGPVDTESSGCIYRLAMLRPSSLSRNVSWRSPGNPEMFTSMGQLNKTKLAILYTHLPAVNIQIYLVKFSPTVNLPSDKKLIFTMSSSGVSRVECTEESDLWQDSHFRPLFFGQKFPVLWHEKFN